MPSTLGSGAVGEGSIGIQGPMIRHASGHIGPIVGDATRTVDLERSSDGHLSPFSGDVSRIVALARSSQGTVTAIAGSATRTIAFARVSEGFISPTVGDVDRTVSLNRSSDGHVGPITGEASPAVQLVRSASGGITPISGDATRSLILARPGDQPSNTVGEGTIGEGVVGEVAEHGPGFIGSIVGEADRTIDVERSSDGFTRAILGRSDRQIAINRSSSGYLSPIIGDATARSISYRQASGSIATIVGEADRIVDLNRAAEGHVNPIQGNATRALRLIRRVAGNTIGNGQLGDGVIGRVEGREPGYLSPIVGEADRTVDLNRLAEGYLSPIVGSIDWGYTDWLIGGELVHSDAGVDLTPTTLSLSFDVDQADLEYWRQYDRTRDIQVETGFGGRFEAIDRDGRDGPMTLEPPFRQTPPFNKTAWYIDGYEESQITLTDYLITLSFHRPTNRADVFDAPTEDGEAWQFEFATGTIAVEEHAVGQQDRDGSTTGTEPTVTLLVSDEQAGLIVDAAGYPDAVVERSVPDGRDFVEDTSGGRQTVTISAPDDASLSGEWAIRDWSLSMHNKSEEPWSVELQLTDLS